MASSKTISGNTPPPVQESYSKDTSYSSSRYIAEKKEASKQEAKEDLWLEDVSQLDNEAQAKQALKLAGNDPNQVVTLLNKDGTTFKAYVGQLQQMLYGDDTPAHMSQGADVPTPAQQDLESQIKKEMGYGISESTDLPTSQSTFPGPQTAFKTLKGGSSSTTGNTWYTSDSSDAPATTYTDVFDQLNQQNMKDELYAKKSDLKKADAKMKTMMNKVMLLFMMGDIVGAIQEYTRQMVRELRPFQRSILQKMCDVKDMRSRLIMRMGERKTQVTGDNSNPKAAAREQNKIQEENQMMQITSQEMSESQDTVRNLTEQLQEMQRWINTAYEFSSSYSEADNRTLSRIINHG